MENVTQRELAAYLRLERELLKNKAEQERLTEALRLEAQKLKNKLSLLEERIKNKLREEAPVEDGRHTAILQVKPPRCNPKWKDEWKTLAEEFLSKDEVKERLDEVNLRAVEGKPCQEKLIIK